MVVLSGLDQQQAAGLDGEVGGDHPRACTAWLTGTHAKMTSGADIRAGVSVDQIAAKEFGKHTQLASLEVGLESAEIVGACESAYGCAYYNTIAWRNETTPLPMENRPRALFERMFGDGGTDPKVRLGHSPRRSKHPRCRQRGHQTPPHQGRRNGSQQDRPVSGSHPRRRAAHPARGEAGRPCSPGWKPGRLTGEVLRLLHADGRHDGPVMADRSDPRHHLPDGSRDERPRLSRARVRRCPPSLHASPGRSREAGEDDPDQRPAHQDARLLHRQAEIDEGRRQQRCSTTRWSSTARA